MPAKKPPTSALPGTLLEASRYFADLDVATEFIAKLRWPQGPMCPDCGGKDHSYLSTRRLWKCKGCKRQFSVKVGTIFEDSPIRLDKWIVAMWMVANCKNGVSSHELARAVGLTQKSAWFVLHRIRLAMQAGSLEKFSESSRVLQRSMRHTSAARLATCTRRVARRSRKAPRATPTRPASWAS